MHAVRDTVHRKSGDFTTGWTTLSHILGANGAAVVKAVRTWLSIGVKTAHCQSGAPAPQVPLTSAYTPFPTGTLPGPVRAYVDAVSAAMSCDSAFSALPALALLGAAIGASHCVQPKKGWKEPSFIWSVAIGESGQGKSPPYRHIEEIAEDVNDQLEQSYEIAVNAGEIPTEECEWTAADADPTSAAATSAPPVRRTFRKGDVTIEALIGVLRDNPRGLFVTQDELSGWVGGFTKYSGKTGATSLPQWLQLHHAGAVNYTRKTGDRDSREIRVRGVGVSVTGTIQPRILARVLTEEYRASGFLARLLLAMPPWRSRHWSEAEVDDPTRAAFIELVNKLFRLPAGNRPDGSPVPHVVRLSPAAKELFRRVNLAA